MSIPTTRTTFKEYCLRKLGSPVIEINVADAQIEDRIDEALTKFANEHYNGHIESYLKHQITEEDKTNKYITLPTNIIGVNRVFPVGWGMASYNMFSAEYQMALSDLYALRTSTQMTDYYLYQRHISMVAQLVSKLTPTRFNKTTDKLYLDISWGTMAVGTYIIIDCKIVVDPTTHTEIYSDEWLIKYTTSLIKQQWGNNLKKFSGMEMPGGISFNGQQIYDEATQELQTLEEELQLKWMRPPHFLVG